LRGAVEGGSFCTHAHLRTLLAFLSINPQKE